MSTLPSSTGTVIIGAGVHGLSTAWHLAGHERARGRSDGIVVLDKTGVGAGASGIACGVVRNNYAQPAMRELMAHSVAVWESDPDAFAYHPVGYVQVAPEVMRADVIRIYEEQHVIGYDSVLVDGARPCRTYLRDLFDDWQAPGASVVLHERQGGYANNLRSMHGLAAKALAAGAVIADGVRVTGFDRDAAGAVRAVETDRGPIACDRVVVAVGPWIRDLWAMLELPERIEVRTSDGTLRPDQPMWTYWALQEGTLGIDPRDLSGAAGRVPPVMHVDSDAPLHDDEDGSLITDRLWGIYYKPDFDFDGVQGGATPVRVERPAGDVEVDPYGPASPDFTVGDDFVRLWTSALAHCHKRFEGLRHRYRREPSGGLGAFTPDSFPVFDNFVDNVYVIADANHGYKMLGVGDLVARELLGDPQPLLASFRFSRFATGDLHPTSHSPFPWS